VSGRERRSRALFRTRSTICVGETQRWCEVNGRESHAPNDRHHDRTDLIDGAVEAGIFENECDAIHASGASVGQSRS